MSQKQFLNEVVISATSFYQKTTVELIRRQNSRVWLCHIDLLDNQLYTSVSKQ